MRGVGVFVRSDAEQLSQLVALVDGGELRVDVAQRVPLAELPAVHAEGRRRRRSPARSSSSSTTAESPKPPCRPPRLTPIAIVSAGCSMSPFWSMALANHPRNRGRDAAGVEYEFAGEWLGSAGKWGGLGRAADTESRRGDASNASGGLRRHLSTLAAAPSRSRAAGRRLDTARAAGHRARGSPSTRRRCRRIADLNGGNALHAHLRLHRVGGVREGDAGEGGLRRPLRDVQHADLARGRAAGAAADHADEQDLHGRAARPTTTRRRSTSSRSSTRRRSRCPNVKVVPTNDIVIPSPGGTTSGCEMSDFPAATSGAIVADPARHLRVHGEARRTPLKAGAVGVIMFNEGDTAGRQQRAVPLGADPGYPIPAVLSSFAVGEELYNLAKAGQNPTVNLATNGVDVETLYPNVVAETKRRRPEPHGAPRARTWTRCPRPGHQRRRLGHGVPARARRAARQGRHAAAQQDPLPVVRRRGGRPGRLAVLRRPPVRRGGRADGHDARHRHDRLAELRAAGL